MTRPTLPGLVARWRKQAAELRLDVGLADDDQTVTELENAADWIDDIAADLSAAMVLSDEEREAIENADWAAKFANDRRAHYIRIALSDYDTLRALVTRLTAAGDGGGKGETK